MKLKGSCSELETYNPWYSYNELLKHNDGGYQAGGSGGTPFSLQYLQHTTQELHVVWDSYSIRSLNMQFTNGKSKKVGSTFPRKKGQTQMYETRFKFQPGEVLDGELLLGEGYSYMNELKRLPNINSYVNNYCKYLGVTYIRFTTNLGRTFEAGLANQTSKFKSFQAQGRIFAGFMGSADTYLNRLGFILYKPVKKKYINKIFWPNLDAVNKLIQEGETLNSKDAILNNVIMHRGLKFYNTESEEKCNKSNKKYDFHVKYNVPLGHDYQVKFNIPYINDKESLLYFFSTFSKHQYDELGSFNDEFYNRNKLNLNQHDINDAYETLLNNEKFSYDHFTTINKCSCVKFNYHTIEGLNKGLNFDIHYMMEFEDGTEFEFFYEGNYNATKIIAPTHEKYEYKFRNCDSVKNVS